MAIDWSTIISNITWQSVASSLINLGITGVLFWGVLQLVATKTIDFKVNKKIQEHKTKLDKTLEDHKIELQHDIKIHEQQLQVLTEEAKYRFNCLSQDYNMYSKERYTTYLAMRKKLLDAVSYTLGLRGLAQIPDFSKYSKEEVEEWVDDHKFGQFHKDSVLSIWDTYPNDAVKRLQELHKLYNEHTAANAYAEVHNYLLETELFISDELLPILYNIKNKIFELQGKYKYAKDVDRKDLPKWVEQEQVLAKEIPELLKVVTAHIKMELTYAHNFKGNK